MNERHEEIEASLAPQKERKLYSIQVDDHTYALVTAAAKELGISRKAYVAQAVAEDYAQTLERKPR